MDMIGEGPDRERLVFAAHDVQLDSVVQFHPKLGTADDVLAAADLYLLPAVQDRPGPEGVEAMRTGLPVVCSDLPGLRTVVEHRVHGIRVPPRDPQALAAAMSDLATNPNLRRYLAEQAQRHARELLV